MENLTTPEIIGYAGFIMAPILMVIGTKVLQRNRVYTGLFIAMMGLFCLTVGAFIII